jgi:hypothetical protein
MEPVLDFKSRVLEYAATMSDEEYAQLIIRFEKLIVLTREFFDLIDPVLTKVGVRPSGTPSEELPDPLCATCARPCPEASPQTQECKKYYEFIPDKCPTCVYLDTTCTRVDPCRAGAGYEPAEGVAV